MDDKPTTVRQMSLQILQGSFARTLNLELTSALILAGIEHRIRSLPEAHEPPSSNGSIDFGRGYAQAVKDVLALFE